MPVFFPPKIVAAMDVLAARTTHVSNGHGIVFTRVGGYFDVTVTASSPANSASVVVTDQTTGVTATITE